MYKKESLEENNEGNATAVRASLSYRSKPEPANPEHHLPWSVVFGRVQFGFHCSKDLAFSSCRDCEWRKIRKKEGIKFYVTHIDFTAHSTYSTWNIPLKEKMSPSRCIRSYSQDTARNKISASWMYIRNLSVFETASGSL